MEKFFSLHGFSSSLKNEMLEYEPKIQVFGNLRNFKELRVFLAHFGLCWVSIVIGKGAGWTSGGSHSCSAEQIGHGSSLGHVSGRRSAATELGWPVGKGYSSESLDGGLEVDSFGCSYSAWRLWCCSPFEAEATLWSLETGAGTGFLSSPPDILLLASASGCVPVLPRHFLPGLGPEWSQTAKFPWCTSGCQFSAFSTIWSPLYH